jgi:type VI secretion system secreted protein Hcp
MTIVLGVVFLSPLRSLGAYNIYLNLTGVTGESTNASYLNQIVVNSFSQRVSVVVSPGSGGGNSVSKPTFTDLTLVKPLDVSSPTLLLDCARGTAFSQAVLTFQDQSSNPTAFYTITLKNVIISSVQSAGSSGGDSRPSETVTLNFTAITWTYQQLDNAGQPVGSPVTHSYNIATGAAS